MPKKHLIMELGMGTDIRGRDYTKTACRAVHNALRQNSIQVADAFGVEKTAMQVEIILGAADPQAVDRDAVAAMLPYGQASVRVEKGGMDTMKDDGTPGPTLVNAALIVSLDLPEAGQ